MQNILKNRRLLFRVILKLLVFSALLFFVGILINSLSTTSNYQNKTKALPLVELDISDMQKGFIRKTQWNGKEVAVLRRLDTKNLPVNQSLNESDNASLNAVWRSHQLDYFVYINTSNCPLYYSQRQFKDICTEKRFDESGRERNVKNNPKTLQVPPHYFVGNTVVFGRWYK